MSELSPLRLRDHVSELSVFRLRGHVSELSVLRLRGQVSDLSVLRLESRVGALRVAIGGGSRVQALRVAHGRGPVCEIQTQTWLRALARTSVPIPVRRQEKSPFPAQWGMCLCHPGMSLVVPFPLRWAWLHGVSCKSPKRVTLF